MSYIQTSTATCYNVTYSNHSTEADTGMWIQLSAYSSAYDDITTQCNNPKGFTVLRQKKIFL